MWSTYFNCSDGTKTLTTKNTMYGKTFIKMFHNDPTSVPKMAFTYKDYGKYIAIDNRQGTCIKKEFFDPIEALKSVGLSKNDLKKE